MSQDSKKYLDFVAESDFNAILTNPILDIAARFWDDDRYEAFKITYRSMRIIDDLVDNRKATGQKITKQEKAVLKSMINDWLHAFNDQTPYDDFQKQLLDTINRFQIPKWPWQRLAKAMMYDLDHSGFDSLLVFLRYSEGAAIAPASIFMHICGINKNGEKYDKPSFDIRQAARPLAIFSYLVHIVRDFEKDQKSHLNYFARDLLLSFNLRESDLTEIANNSQYPDSFRKLMITYHIITDYYRDKSRTVLDQLLPTLDEKYRLSLELIYHLYLQIFERIDPQKGSFTTLALNPSPEEIKIQIQKTIEII